MTRRFSPQPLDPMLVDELLDLARRAPSAGFSQGVHFLVLRDESVRTFWSTTGAGEWFGKTQPGVLQAPVIVLPLAFALEYTGRYAEPDKQGHGLEEADNWAVPFWLTDTAMAVQNMLLLAEDRGLGALYFGIFRNADVLLRELGVPDGAQPLGAVALGHRAPEDVPTGSPSSRRRRDLTDVVHHDHW
jgi:nitroreductase